MIERRRTIRSYDLTREEFELLRDAQANQCAICAVVFDETPHIDHDHVTGAVRGLLCRACNLGLGIFADDTDRLAAAIAYLTSHGNGAGER